MGAGYGLAPSTQAQALVEQGALVDLAPDQPVLVNLYWHHWAMEPPIAQEITGRVVDHARHCLIQPHATSVHAGACIPSLPVRRAAREGALTPT
jgi:LysR family transcriptional regulator (chromosome initiation inhibitor)